MTRTTGVAHYAPGPSAGIAASSLWVVIDDEPGGQMSLTVLEAVVGGAGGDAVLDLLLAQGLREAPSFAMVEQGLRGWRVAGRGAGLVEVEVDGEIALLHGRRGLLDEDVEFADVLTLSLGPGPVTTPIPMARGLVPVEGIRVVSATTPSGPHEGSGAPVAGTAVPPSPWARLSETASVENVHGGSESEGVPSVEVGRGAESASQYDNLFAPQGDAPVGIVGVNPAVVDVDPNDSPAVGESLGDASRNGDLEEPPLERLAAPARVAGAFIDSMPDFQGGPGSRPSADSPPTATRDHQIGSPPLEAAASADGAGPTARGGRTVRRGSLSEAAAASGPLVYAARCPRNHLSPAHAARCRVCGEAVAAQEPFEVPRPPLGQLVVSTGDVIVLDRDVYLGREPTLPDVPGPTVPHLVRLVDPRQEVSSEHARVCLNYWHVMLEDLASTNGTEIIAPDGRRQRLVAHSPVVIEPGSTIVLAEIIEVRFEASS